MWALKMCLITPVRMKISTNTSLVHRKQSCVGKPCIRTKPGCLLMLPPSTPVASKPFHSKSCFTFASDRMVQTWGVAHTPFLIDLTLTTQIFSQLHLCVSSYYNEQRFLLLLGRRKPLFSSIFCRKNKASSCL